MTSPNAPNTVYVFPGAAIYHRLPLREVGDPSLPHKRVDTVDRNGEPLRIVFMRPQTRRDPVDPGHPPR